MTRPRLFVRGGKSLKTPGQGLETTYFGGRHRGLAPTPAQPSGPLLIQVSHLRLDQWGGTDARSPRGARGWVQTPSPVTARFSFLTPGLSLSNFTQRARVALGNCFSHQQLRSDLLPTGMWGKAGAQTSSAPARCLDLTKDVPNLVRSGQLRGNRCRSRFLTEFM